MSDIITKYHAEDDSEFLPLPYYVWLERPLHIPITVDEAATALHLEHGVLFKAAERLRVSEVRLLRCIRRSPMLARLLEELAQVVVHRAVGKYVEALFDPDPANMHHVEWAASRVVASRAAMEHPLAPASSASDATASVAIADRRIVFTWRAPSSSSSTELPDE